MPHKVTTIKRFRISDDVLILILEKLNPISLFRSCQAFERIYALVMRFQPLRYKFELAAIGMKDGPAPYSTCPPVIRLQLVMAYKTDWPRLKWIKEQRVRAPAAATSISVSGSFLYYVANQALCLLELPSYRTGKPIGQAHPITYNSNPNADCVAIDTNLRLIVTSHFSPQNGRVLLKIRDLYSFEKHPNARSAYYECVTHIAQPVQEISMSICDSKLICSFHFAPGLSKHLLLDWISLKAMWLEEQDIALLNSYILLGVKRLDAGKVTLYLYNISNMDKVFIEREYQLPPIWNNSTMRFVRNSVPNSERAIPSNALFCSDPTARVLALTAKPETPGSMLMHCMFINESFFRPTPYENKRIVPWEYWSQFCIIKELQLGLLAGTPRVAGSRVFYLEKDGTRSTSGHYRTKLKVIDFAPYTDITPSSKSWSLYGQFTTLKPTEYQRDFSSTTTDGLAVENIHATEDNIILQLENHGDIKPVVISTFGPSTNHKASRQEIQYPVN